MQHYVFKMFQVTAMVRNGYKKYSRKPDAVPYSVDDYIDIISHVAGKKLNPMSVNSKVKWEPKAFKGQIFKRGDEADILVPQVKTDARPHGVTECEQRFAVIKEACHTLLNVENTFVDQLSAHVTRVVTSGPSVVLNDVPSIIQDEYLGEIAAMELLFPFSKRDEYITKIKNKQTTTLKIAQRYKIPEKKVINTLSDGIHPALKAHRGVWMDEMDNHIAGMPVPSVDMPPRSDC